MQKLDTFIGSDEARKAIQALGDEFAVVKNPSYIHPAYELYPLAVKITEPVPSLKAAVMDMDGTTTTTEALCIHSLEYMIRKITDRMPAETWSGLDRRKDYPHIIGNSTTKHVEYLINTYGQNIDRPAMNESYLEGAIWTLVNSRDPGRINDVKNNLVNLGCGGMIKDIQQVEGAKDMGQYGIYGVLLAEMKKCYLPVLNIETHTDLVRAGIDIYYQRYHEILEKIERGKGEDLACELLGSAGKHLIEPMKGIGVFIALVKGWLGEEITALVPQLKRQLKEKGINPGAVLPPSGLEEELAWRGRQFEKHPLKVAVVTSSILYEARIVMTEVFRVLRQQVEEWPLSEKRKQLLLDKFSHYENVYDGFVTATDSSEIRLKPHRDLYSIALHQLGIPKAQFNQVMGFEDSESGTIAIRAAGIGLCLAVPFSDTQHHDFRAASHVLQGGLPETILKHLVFLRQQ